MRPLVGPGQLFQVQVGVALGGAQAGVAEEFLDGAEIHAPAQEVRGEAVPEGVRAHLGPQRRALDDLGQEGPDAGGREPASPLVQEQGRRRREVLLLRCMQSS